MNEERNAYRVFIKFTFGSNETEQINLTACDLTEIENKLRNKYGKRSFKVQSVELLIENVI